MQFGHSWRPAEPGLAGLGLLANGSAAASCRKGNTGHAEMETDPVAQREEQVRRPRSSSALAAPRWLCVLSASSAGTVALHALPGPLAKDRTGLPRLSPTLSTACRPHRAGVRDGTSHPACSDSAFCSCGRPTHVSSGSVPACSLLPAAHSRADAADTARRPT